MSTPLAYRFADLKLDVGRRRLERAGQPIELGKLTYLLLVALVESAPNVLTHDELVRRVWGGRATSPETVTQRVKLLRDALQDDSERPRYIGLVRGQGYRFIPSVEPLRESSVPAAREPPSGTLASPHRDFLANGVHATTDPRSAGWARKAPARNQRGACNRPHAFGGRRISGSASFRGPGRATRRFGSAPFRDHSTHVVRQRGYAVGVAGREVRGLRAARDERGPNESLDSPGRHGEQR